MGFAGSSFLAKFALFLSLFTLIIFIVGFSTDYWLLYENEANYGLWEHCVPYIFGDECRYIKDSTGLAAYQSMDRFDATRAMECIGLIFAIINFLAVVVYVFISSGHAKRSHLWIIGIATAFLAMIFIIIGIIIFGATYDVGLSWSFVLCIVAAVLYFILGVVLIIEKKNVKGES